jgi:hypothetical protein
METKGDAKVARSGHFGRRANQGLTTYPPIATALYLQPHSHWWNRVQTDGTGSKPVYLPDPSVVDVTNGWVAVIQNDSPFNVIEVLKSNGAFLVAIPPMRALDVILIDETVAGGDWYIDGIIELHEEVSFLATDWVNNQIIIIAQGTPVVGQVGPHGLPVGNTYSINIWQELSASNVREVGVSTYIDKSTGNIRLLKSACVAAFAGSAFLCART